MNIGRKQALLALAAGVAGALSSIGKRASAAPVPTPLPSPAPTVPIAPIVAEAATIDDLKKRVAALEAALASQVAFTKDAAGNLTLRSAGSVSVQAGTSLSLRASADANVVASGPMTVKGAIINLN